MKVTLITSTPEHLVGDCAKVCYANRSDKDITSSLVHKHKHLAVLRFAYAVVKVEDISVACHTQIVRSKHLDFLVQSKRYVDPNKGQFKFIMPNNIPIKAKELMEQHWSSSISLYNKLIDIGIKKEDARAILPANTSTSMYIAGNLQAYWDFFKLRLNKHAQEEIRNVAKEIYRLLSKEYPKVFTKEVYNNFLNQ